MPFPFIIRLIGACLVAIVVAAGGESAWSAEGTKPGTPTIAAAATVEADGGKTRFKVTLSKAVTAQVSVMERPDRVIIDLPEVAFHLPAEAGRSKEDKLSAVQYVRFAIPGAARRAFADPAVPARLVVDHPRYQFATALAGAVRDSLNADLREPS